MARTVTEIYNEMLAAKAADSNLSGLTSTSLVSVWRLILYIYAVSIKIHEDIMDLFQEDVEARSKEIAAGTANWYAAESKKFQYGDSLVWGSYDLTDSDGITRSTYRLDYATIDETKQIVEYSAASSSGGLLTIKAAKVVSGVPQKLSGPETTAFTAYWTEKRFAGTAIAIVSQDPDLAKLAYTITYNPLVMSSTGESLATAGVYPVRVAIDDFLAAFSNDEFGGVVKVMKLTSAIENVVGVLNAFPTVVECKPSAGSYTNVLAATYQTYTPQAGYMKVDPAFPLSSQLTYVAG
jgi:hypothetical protein